MSDPESEIRDVAEKVADAAHHPSVKRATLDNTLGFLNSTPPVALLGEGESVQFIFFNRKEGIERDFTTSEKIEPSESRGALLIITDERILILIGQENGDTAISISYGVVEGVSCDVSLLGSNWLGFAGTSAIHIDTRDGRVTVPVIEVSKDDLKQATRHVKSYAEDTTDGDITEVEPEIEYDPRGDGSPPEYKTILACRECHEEVSRGVQRCPHCGFDPEADTRGAAWKVSALGISTTILAPLGIAMGYDSAKKSRDASKGVWIEKTVEITSDDEDESTSSSNAQKLRELDTLHSEGVLSDEEYQKKKEQILSNY